ncbi:MULTISPECIES: Crp/Fnr family transcriptional regulator [Bradyrhizobium]|jgi:CRP-like cAMP-binding protein|uniref:Crp/Fnr family transcriptional regulator n=1 Tax=Bradyrhizobium TaxID=374 RepID=UPI0004B47ADD|nr:MULTISPECIES: Crp/Fnr family transcriptional regulator [Bradyrhizobium]MCS3453697.1 CRP-like cAMP-binding protein [Bradyrhizobium elkanii]MCS3564196.1 CRP-like cAMP-binding protein [Bradyrhizobium elkanii]MCW2145972.1 CRP-like cAMP-binding protein [Bradyrhizobium elkanii]MCW2354955.1 CRP-like cAMP-binding protein [Bradyrhizobium elkanii]MCW2378799.1 CRP-like cAMP-binding protein [Bradyrhizobium elkanii]
MSAVSRPPNRLLQALPSTEYAQLHPLLETVDLTRETALANAGAPVQRVYFPHSGVVSMMINLSDGQSVEIATIGRDGVVGASAALHERPLLADAIVVVPGSASMVRAEDFREAVDRSADFRTLVALYEQALMAQTQQSVACNVSHPVEARLSRWLLRARDLCGSEALPLTQEMLAQMIGVRRNAVSIVAHGFQQAGILRYSRGHIEITDIDGLRKAACECYTTVKAHAEQLIGPED